MTIPIVAKIPIPDVRIIRIVFSRPAMPLPLPSHHSAGRIVVHWASSAAETENAKSAARANAERKAMRKSFLLIVDPHAGAD